MAKDHSNQIKKKRHAELLIRQGRLEEAENIYRELITENTNDHIVYGNLAALYGKQGKIKESILLLNKSLQINPNYQQAHYNLGMAYKHKGDFKAAITSFKKSESLGRVVGIFKSPGGLHSGGLHSFSRHRFLFPESTLWGLHYGGYPLGTTLWGQHSFSRHRFWILGSWDWDWDSEPGGLRSRDLENLALSWELGLGLAWGLWTLGGLQSSS